jgi:hypothetical protein
MASTIKVDNVQNQPGTNIINKCSTTITIGASSDTVALAAGASQTGFGSPGQLVDWQTSIKTSTITAVTSEGYFVDTTGGAITANLPAGVVGAIVAFKDYAQNFATNALTISADGSEKIEGETFDLVLETKGQGVTLIYGDATKGWQAVNSNEIVNTEKFVSATGGTETIVCTNFKVHTFTGPGLFNINCAGNVQGSNSVDYMVVAGGGGAGGAGAGAGAGGFRESPGTASGCYTVSPLGVAPAVALPVAGISSFSIVVGGGGASSGPACAGSGTPGSTSTFSTIDSAGGGQGNDYGPTGTAGGSGSGSGSAGPGAGGAGNTPPTTPAQGTAGGCHPGAHGANYSGSGGGGATVAGTPAPSPNAGTAGGAGATPSITGSAVARAGGGGGGLLAPGGCAGAGGTGGGGVGNAGLGSPYAGTPGTVNTGGGGGGGSGSSTGAGDRGGGGAGGSGIVVIRYKFQ